MKILGSFVNLFVSDYKTQHIEIVRQIEKHVKVLPCLGLPSPNTFKIVETDASEIGYGGILKQRTSNFKEQLVRYHSGIWNTAQQNYSTIKKRNFSYCIMYS
jgi:hypothetical protein